MKLLSKTIKETIIKYNFLGIHFSIKNKQHYNKLKIESNEAKIQQDLYDLSNLQNAEKLILFLIQSDIKTNGGIMSIFSLCQTSRKLNTDSVCILSTYPNAKYTHAKNETFPNEEQIYRFSQIVDNCKNLKEMIIHIPEYYAKQFYKNLTKKDIEFLKSIKSLQLNILNQNIELMPKPKKWHNLYKLTNNITQTIAHNRYATQEVCNKYKIPTHLFSVNFDLSKYKKYPFEEKEKIIVLSPDENSYKSQIVKKLKAELPDWQFITVQSMTFPQYMDLVGKAYFTITFGEGMDGYFSQPVYVKSLGFAVYNDKFFPNNSWKNLKNVYSSYEKMEENICNDLKMLYSNKDLYYLSIQEHLNKIHEFYNINNYLSNIERFYKKEYDFYPECNINKTG